MFYVFVHTDSPDGEHIDLHEINGVSTKFEARQAFEKEQMNVLNDYGDKPSDHLRHLEQCEINYIRVAFLEVQQIEEFDYVAFKEAAIQRLKRLVKDEKTDGRRQQYEELKKEFGE